MILLTEKTAFHHRKLGKTLLKMAIVAFKPPNAHFIFNTIKGLELVTLYFRNSSTARSITVSMP
jgi:hypothetical protein